MLTLPTGARGRALALALLVGLTTLAWFSAAAPILQAYADRAELLQERQTLATRMAAVVEGLPELRHQAGGETAGPGAQAVLEGNSDAIAGASLQAQLEAIATKVGTSISTLELLPAEAVGTYRRLSLRINVSGPWSGIVHLLEALADASPRMLVDDVQLQTSPSVSAGAAPIAASVTVIAFRAGP